MRLIFLDIDGVLNSHNKHRHPNGYCGIDPACVYRLNRIVAETGAKIVISSAWRYLVYKGSMNVDGVKSMLMTYGLNEDVEIAGYTPRDESISDRGPQIANWIDARGRYVEVISSYVILDDGSDEPPHPPATKPLTESLIEHHERGVIVFTDPAVGLTDADADRAIQILRARNVAERDATPERPPIAEASRSLWEHYYAGYPGMHPYIQCIGDGADAIHVYLVREPYHFEEPIPTTWRGWPIRSQVIGRVTVGPPDDD